MDATTVVIKEEGLPSNEQMTDSEQIWKFVSGYYHLFLSRKILILIFCFAGAGLGLTYALLKKKVYTAEVKFTSNVDNNDAGGYVSLAQQFGLMNGGSSNGAFSGDNLMELMKTPSLINKTLFTPVIVNNQQVLLFDYYLQSKKIRDGWKDNKALMNIRFNANLSQPDFLRDSILKLVDMGIGGELSIDKTEKELDFISVKMTDEDPIFAKTFSETLVKTVTDYYVGIMTGKYAENVKVLQGKADSLNQNFGRRLVNIASSEDINVNPNRRIANVPIQRQQMGVQVDNAVYQEIIKNLELAKIQLQKQTPFIQIIETPRYPLDETRASKSISMIVGFIMGGALIIIFLVAWREGFKVIKKLNSYSDKKAVS